MSTNYYWQPSCEVCGCSHEKPPQTHIGKSSAGWTFSFQATDEIRSAAEWRRIISLGHGVIRDEYGRTVTPEEFSGLVESKQKGVGNLNHAAEYPNDSFIDGEGYSMSEGDFT